MVALLLCTLISWDGQVPYSVEQAPPPPVIDPASDLVRADSDSEGFHLLVGSLLAMGSDSAFPRFIGPLSNPWLAKDPRSLSEARLLGVFNFFPDSHSFSDGLGQSYLLQIRAAINKRWSVFLDKSGYTFIDPGNGQGTRDGWNNLAFGAKFVFIRDVEHQFLLSGGIQYEAPTGEAAVFQRPGDGNLTLFASVGKEFCCFWHVVGNVGSRIPLSSQGSTLFYSQIHVDRELMGWLYPLVELNWYRLASDGRGSLPASLGQADAWIDWSAPGTVGSDLVTFAVGMKAKYSRMLEAGLAYEKSISGTPRTLEHRLIAEVIFRY